MDGAEREWEGSARADGAALATGLMDSSESDAGLMMAGSAFGAGTGISVDCGGMATGSSGRIP